MGGRIEIAFMFGPKHPLVVALAKLRELVIARLKEAFAREELEMEEFERRVALAENARTTRELKRLTSDLPEPEAGLTEYRETLRTKRVPRPRSPRERVRWSPLAVLLAAFGVWTLFCLADFVRAVAP